MEFHTTISWSSPFQILGVLEVFFFQSLIEDSLNKHEATDQTPHYAVSDLDLHCLSMSHKKDARLILVTPPPRYAHGDLGFSLKLFQSPRKRRQPHDLGT